jgi:16S rRNA (adenine1518-N6/adenine1519-N6)-dimethyltransferase
MSFSGSRPDPSKDQFLMEDAGLLGRVVSLAGIRKGETVLEIGAGTGLLTRELAKKAAVIAVESDERFLEGLRGIPGVKAVNANILDVLDGLRFDAVVSNIPYSISEPLLRRLSGREFRIAVLCVPERFGRRLTARPGSPFRSELSFFAQAFFRMEAAFAVPRESFRPRPGTRSVVMVLRPREKGVLQGVLLRGRSGLRKALLQSLTGGKAGLKAGSGMTKNDARKIINTLGINRLLEKRVNALGISELEEVGCVLESLPKNDY